MSSTREISGRSMTNVDCIELIVTAYIAFVISVGEAMYTAYDATDDTGPG
jgi:hypothetical protein